MRGRPRLLAALESLRVGASIGMAAVLGYLATAPGSPSLAALGLLCLVTAMASGGAGALDHPPARAGASTLGLLAAAGPTAGRRAGSSDRG